MNIIAMLNLLALLLSNQILSLFSYLQASFHKTFDVTFSNIIFPMCSDIDIF
jgi:hypothetical protein